MGAAADPVGDFVAELRLADGAFGDARERLLAAELPDTAFGRLFEARSVHDAYHQRLPEMARNLDEARAVLGHLIHGLLAAGDGAATKDPRQSAGDTEDAGGTG